MPNFSVEIYYRAKNGEEKRNKQSVSQQDAGRAISEAVKKFKKKNADITVLNANIVK